MAKKEGNELATVKVYLNTGIIAGLVGVGFVASTLIFGVILLLLKWILKKFIFPRIFKQKSIHRNKLFIFFYFSFDTVKELLSV